MKIIENKGDTEVLISKSTRDLCMSDKIPINCGLSNCPFTSYIVGKPGSGKSHYIESLMKKQYQTGSGKQTCFDSIYVVAPETSKTSYKNSYICDCDPDKVYDELNYKNLQEIYDGIIETKESGDDKKKNDNYYSLLVIDDCASELRDKNVQKLLLKLLRNHRHLHASVLIVSQNYMAINKDCRDNLRQLVQFSTTNRKEKERIQFEWVGFLKVKEFENLWEFLFKEPYQFLMADRKTEEIHKTFNKIEISELDRGC